MKRLQTRGFGLKETHSDQQFKKACEIFRSKHDPPIKFNYANAKEHVPRAEKETLEPQKKESVHHVIRCRANTYQKN